MAENPEMSITQIAARLGSMWRRMSDEQKQPYTVAAAAEREKPFNLCRDIVASLNAYVGPCVSGNPFIGIDLCAFFDACHASLLCPIYRRSRIARVHVDATRQ